MKDAPIVEDFWSKNLPSTYRSTRHVLPTPAMLAHPSAYAALLVRRGRTDGVRPTNGPPMHHSCGGAESTPCWCAAATDATHGIETQEVATSRSVLRCARERVSVRLSALIGMAIKHATAYLRVTGRLVKAPKTEGQESGRRIDALTL